MTAANAPSTGVPVSFEFFPPKTPEGAEKLRAVRQQLYALRPEFCSVTYGAGGSTQEGTFGTVREIAEVLVNGKNLGVLWWPPFRLDVTDAVRPGTNQLEVRVTNLWVNRLIGDEQVPDDVGWQGVTFSSWPEWLVKGTPRPEPRRKTFTTWRHNRADSPLIPSGLIGPVVLHPVSVYRLQD